MRISDWSSDVCSSDLIRVGERSSIAPILILVEFDEARPVACCLLRYRDCETAGIAIIGKTGIISYQGARRVRGAAAGARFTVPLRRRRARTIGRASCRERVCQSV